MFITKKHLTRRTFLTRHGRSRIAAVPRVDDARANSVAQDGRCAAFPAGLHRDGAWYRPAARRTVSTSTTGCRKKRARISTSP